MPSTFVVPPTFIAQIYGVTAVEITARKLYLIGFDDKRQAGKFYKTTDQIAEKSFEQLVDFIRNP